MSFVSRILERIGVLDPEVSPREAPEPPEDDDRYATAPTLPPTARFSAAELAAFDPDQTLRSEDFDDLTDRTEIGDVTLVGDPPEVTAVSSAHRAPGSRVSLRSLLAQRGLAGPISLPTAPPDFDTPFDVLFSRAGLGPAPGGWTVDRAGEVILAARADGLTPARVRFLLEEALVRDGATPRDVAADAAARDEILDAFEARLAERVERTIAEREAEAEALARQIRALRERRDAVLADIAATRGRFATWRDEKRRLERRWADVLDVLAPFLTVSG